MLTFNQKPPKMTVSELMYQLENLPQDAEVLFASQPAWPFEYSIGGVFTTDDDPDGELPDYEPVNSVVYIYEGAQLGYLDENAREQLGW